MGKAYNAVHGRGTKVKGNAYPEKEKAGFNLAAGVDGAL